MAEETEEVTISKNMNQVLLFFNLGGGEIFIILLIILLMFGSKKIPELARGLGKGIRYFKDATSDMQEEIRDSVKDVDVDSTPDKDKS